MKILLIDPPFYRLMGFYNRFFPFGLTIIGTALKNAGYPVSIFDADYNENPEELDYSQLPSRYALYLSSFKDKDHKIWKEIEDTIRQEKPDLIGISIWTTYAASSFHVARLAKKVLPQCPVVMGGAHATHKAEEILSICEHVDYVIQGPGEKSILDLVSHLAQGAIGLEQIPGLWYRAGNRMLHNPPFSKPCKGADELIIPDRSLLRHEDTYTPEDMGLLMTTIGCPYACSFCASHQKKVTFQTIERIIREIKHVKERYGTWYFSIKDDSFTVNRKHVAALCQRIIQENLNISWQCNTRVNLVNPELLKLMKKAGCNGISIGIESGSRRILEKMNKGITHDQVRKAATMIKEAHIHLTGYFMIGVPTETEADIEATMAFLSEIKPDFACIGVYEPFPGTAMFEDGLSKGLVKNRMSLEEFFTTLPSNYYKTPELRQVDTIEQSRFLEIEKRIKQQINTYNTRLPRLIKMAKARIGVYRHAPLEFFNDVKKYFSYKITG